MKTNQMKHRSLFPPWATTGLAGFLLICFGTAFWSCEKLDVVPRQETIYTGATLDLRSTYDCGVTAVLWAGQHHNVGDVSAEVVGSNLGITYLLTGGWYVTEIHTHAATSVADFPQTKTGNPKVGHFAYSDYFEPEDMVMTTAIVIPLSALDWTPGGGDPLYIAAHAVVCQAGGMTAFTAVLPDQVALQVTHPGTGYGHASYFDAAISGGTVLDGTYDSYCLDADHTINPGMSYMANVYSSYEALPSGLVEYPENLDLVNYLINQGFEGQPSGCDGAYTYGDVQRAIWELIEDDPSTAGLGPWSPCRVEEILEDVTTNGEGFIPDCGDKIAVILVPVGNQQITIAQVTFAEVGVPCVPTLGCETAWAGELGFPGRNWARYFILECEEVPPSIS